MSKTKMAQLTYHLFQDCPKCGETFDLSDDDYVYDYTVSELVFNSKWDEIKGIERECPKCGHGFELSGLEH